MCKTSNSETRVQLAMLAVHAVQSSFVALYKVIADEMKAYLGRYRINTSNGQTVRPSAACALAPATHGFRVHCGVYLWPKSLAGPWRSYVVF